MTFKFKFAGLQIANTVKGTRSTVQKLTKSDQVDSKSMKQEDHHRSLKIKARKGCVIQQKMFRKMTRQEERVEKILLKSLNRNEKSF